MHPITRREKLKKDLTDLNYFAKKVIFAGNHCVCETSIQVSGQSAIAATNVSQNIITDRKSIPNQPIIIDLQH